MSAVEIDFFTSVISASKNYLDYGMGGSTRLAVRSASVQTIFSVESDPQFLSSELLPDSDIQNAIKSGRLKFLAADIGPTGAWGTPRDTSKIHLWPNYAMCPFLHGNPTPDLVLIDGRFRVACSLVAALEAPSATLLIHDYTIRPYYKIIERFLEIEQTVDTLVRCRRARHFDPRAAHRILKEYLYLPGDESQKFQARLQRKLSRMKQRLKKRL